MEALHDVVRAGKARYLGASTWPRGSSRRRRPRERRLDAVRLHAEPLQPRLPRGGARDDPALRRPGRRRHPVQPARPRPPRRHPLARGRAPKRARRLRSGSGRPVRARRGLRCGRAGGGCMPPGARGAPARVALAWLLLEAGVTAPIVGATRIEHVDDALAAAALDLSAERRSRGSRSRTCRIRSRLEEPAWGRV